MVKSNYTVEMSYILNTQAQSMLVIDTDKELWSTKHQNAWPLDKLPLTVNDSAVQEINILIKKIPREG